MCWAGPAAYHEHSPTLDPILMNHPYELWTLAHPQKSFRIRCLLDPEPRELLLLAGAGGEITREVFPTTDVACERAEVLKQRLLAVHWQAVA
jgi:hypothetical protein